MFHKGTRMTQANDEIGAATLTAILSEMDKKNEQS